MQSRVFEVLGEKSCCSRSFSGLLLTAECRGPMLYGVTHTSLGEAGHCSSQKAIRVFSRKGNYYTQVSSKHARNLSLANFWIRFFRFAPLPDASNDSMVKLTVVVVIFYGPTIIKSIIFGLSPLIIVLFSGGSSSLSTSLAYSSHAVDILHSVHSSQLDRKLVLLRALLTGPQRTLHSYKKG